MTLNRFEKFSTLFVQEIGSKEGNVSPAINNSASFSYGTPENAEAIFNGSIAKPLYSRMGNPTNAKLENILAKMDGGIGAIATSSGMGAITLATISLLQSGDEIISIGGLFGRTYAYFTETLARFGIKTHFFDVDELEKIKNTITTNTKIIFCESVGNPNMRLPDLRKISDISNKHKIVLIIDNTITPMSISPLELGADIVVYSTTKIISGNSSALGGAVVFRAINDEDKFKTDKYKTLHPFIRNLGEKALIANAKKRALRDLGMTAAASNSYLIMLGLETLPLRMQRITSSIEKIVKTLHRKGLHVNHPTINTHPHHQRYKELFPHGCGTLFTIDFGTKEKAFSFLNKTKIATITANIGDSRTLALHMESTIYRDFSTEDKKFLGITPGLIRVSIGLENPDDIIKDFMKSSLCDLNEAKELESNI